jgi:uncharacterized protein YecE (DUF72 family)
VAAAIKVGISAWTEPTLVASGFYPPGVSGAEARLRYYAAHFPLVEVDMPYYAIPALHQVEAWRDRTPAGFTMNVKAFALLTGHYTDPRRLPPDLRATLPPALRAKARLYPKDVGPTLLDELGRRFRAALEPLRASGRLGLVLLQYPVWFTHSRAALAELARARTVLPELPLAIEFRNFTWMSERHARETLGFLREHDLTYTSVDEPQGFPSSVPPVAAATSRIALVRMHGRNVRAWDARAATVAERFGYLYDTDELAAWVPRVAALAQESAAVHVVLNNCYRDYAVRNATELATLLARAHLPLALIEIRDDRELTA